LLSIVISLFYMFRAAMCPSSGEITVSMRHWYLSLCMGGVWSAGWSETPTSPCAHHQEKLLYLCDTGICYSVWVASRLLVGVKLQPADQTPPIQSDKYQCRIDTVISPDDGHMVARNIQRREINILSTVVHLVGFICKKVVRLSALDKGRLYPPGNIPGTHFC